MPTFTLTFQWITEWKGLPGFLKEQFTTSPVELTRSFTPLWAEVFAAVVRIKSISALVCHPTLLRVNLGRRCVGPSVGCWGSALVWGDLHPLVRCGFMLEWVFRLLSACFLFLIPQEHIASHPESILSSLHPSIYPFIFHPLGQSCLELFTVEWPPAWQFSFLLSVSVCACARVHVIQQSGAEVIFWIDLFGVWRLIGIIGLISHLWSL